MKDYIEREALRDALYEADAITMKGVKILNLFPSADVRPVVRASWEEKEKDGVWWYACSVCGEHISKGRWGQR